MNEETTLNALRCILVVLGIFLILPVAYAEDAYPSRPVVLVVPFPPGGSGDVQARILAETFAKYLGQSVVVENRPGGSTAIGASYVAHAKPDGYTLLLSSGSTFTLNPALQKSLPYDPMKSFQPIGMISRVGLVLLAHPDVPFNRLDELVEASKETPGKFTYATFGIGTSSHFAASIAFHAMGIQLVHVPYRGSAPAMTDLIGGHVSFLFDTVTSAVPKIRAGKVKALAITSPIRSPLLPEVPTFAESGYPEVVFDSWGMMAGPTGLPSVVLKRLESALAKTIGDQTVRQRLAEQGVDAMFADASRSFAHLEAELPLMRAVAVRANIQPE
ncbi:tripartite tricarboxylate transporter substrate binding protein [Variovorax defluvii]|uniref:Tripartite tricarboxylate transporter substrate binding protein n=1 Tax=Variovorax defluvii TaxID=913761 RepID=A0ABP8GWE3_9BURK